MRGVRRGRGALGRDGLSRRVLIWVVVAAVAVVVVYLYRSSGSHPAKTLTRDALPVAAAYARDVVSAVQCKQAKRLADAATNDPCKVFASLQGMTITGPARLVRGCDDVTSKVTGRLRDHDCAALPIAAGKRGGHLYVWLEHHGSGWRVAAAVSLVRRKV